MRSGGNASRPFALTGETSICVTPSASASVSTSGGGAARSRRSPPLAAAPACACAAAGSGGVRQARLAVLWPFLMVLYDEPAFANLRQHLAFVHAVDLHAFEFGVAKLDKGKLVRRARSELEVDVVDILATLGHVSQCQT